MALSHQEITLQSALQDMGLRELPPEWNPETSTLVDGIALVVKATGKEYCKVADVNGKISVVRDYGHCASILRFEKIYSNNVITKANIPTFKDDNEIIHFLSKSKYDRAEIEALIKEGNREEINRRIYELTIESEKRKSSERERVDKIKKFAESQPKKPRTNGRRKKTDN